ncbi:hypothetical protein GCM10007036_31030 [Alsobacter metallidurans]|uniref:Uncharacterized protein n=1 Tax=Alsobacter metallidurans TaxID=340221 RepID=A0A917I8W2_9HYPH|nr:hypothetical protein [Alsobacter metallidurans]GGH24552.1 hypothetical protein GCM10007036_31030 [Alsobacter metallidurans]
MIAGVLIRGALRDQRRALLAGEVDARCPTCGFVSTHHLYGRRSANGSLVVSANAVTGDGLGEMMRFAQSSTSLEDDFDIPF